MVRKVDQYLQLGVTSFASGGVRLRGYPLTGREGRDAIHNFFVSSFPKVVSLIAALFKKVVLLIPTYPTWSGISLLKMGPFFQEPLEKSLGGFMLFDGTYWCCAGHLPDLTKRRL